MTVTFSSWVLSRNKVGTHLLSAVTTIPVAPRVRIEAQLCRYSLPVTWSKSSLSAPP